MEDALTLTTLAESAAEMARSIDTIWVLVTAALVFFMQAGFALVEAGFTRSKNTVNILYKNLMDFSVGSIVFWILGFGLMFGSDIAGFIGSPNFFFKNGWEGGIPAEAFLIFQTVFAATAATIVSGAMAERTEFKSYLIFSLVISAVIYPVSGHWIWGGGWLSQLATPFHDFAGSTVVHMVGGVIALTGTLALGPRIGKYSGKKVNAIPGHNMVLGALGVFILWLGWFGFNPGSQLAASGAANSIAISHIFVTTNLAAAAGALAGVIVSWLKWGKPSLSLALNGALAGLVGITAGCAVVTATGALIIGLISGVVLVYSVTFFDNVLHIDDPVGAVSVHGVCGALGTIMVGLFSESTGLFYGHGTAQLLSQLIGVVAVAAWAGLTGFILFKILKATVGLRVPKRIEEEGLDIYEHGESAYN
ncbi:MAG TPA: ammonium transporter [Prolixibacteraceae bacterium]|nr:MAG: ammonium transporter [Bacteroidetes bacterium GWB2_41_8]HCY43339.1 ammonium transporter [Prolixibacteraceae bacterium]